MKWSPDLIGRPIARILFLILVVATGTHSSGL